MDHSQAMDTVTLRNEVMALKDNFKKLVREQETLGIDDTSGLRGKLGSAGNAVERIINEAMTWLDTTEANKLMMALLAMRHHEAEYRLSQRELTRQQFLESYRQFNNMFMQIDGTPAMKGSLEEQVKTYADTFAHWVDAFERVRPLRVVIDLDSQRMLPKADDIISRAGQRAEVAAAALTVSQARTRTGIIAVGIAMVALGLGFSWLIGRSITRPLNGLAGVMKQLADGDTSARIPATTARDEIGEMARTVIVFRDTTVERENLAQTQAEIGAHARAAQRNHRRHHRPVQAFGRKRAEQASLGRDAA